MFSVIIPLYNKAAYIEKALRSVLNQSFHDFEVIIVNDGSTDNGVLMVDYFLRSQQQEGNLSVKEHVRIINQSNMGAATARNNGVKAAKYEFIAFLDADDWWHKHYLAEMKQLIDAYPDATLYGSSYYQVKHGRQTQATIGVPPDFKMGNLDYCRVYAKTLCMPISTSAAVIRKSIFMEEKGFKPALKLGEDFDLWIRLALHHQVAFLNKPLAYYNHDVDGLSRGVRSTLYLPEEHYIFNLGYLESFERHNEPLKILLDALRVYVLMPYYLNKLTRDAALIELAKVDWSRQPLRERIRYRSPIGLLQLQQRVMQFGSKAKQAIKHGLFS
ncbi:MAG: glycosyltransferase family 2 protein [Microbacter sp.]